MAEENKLNQTPEITPAPSAEAPEKAPTTGELLGDVLRVTIRLDQSNKVIETCEIVLTAPPGMSYGTSEYNDFTTSGYHSYALLMAMHTAADPAVLLLDEITANLDAETEARVLEALRRASEGRTVLSVSHRIYENLGGRTVEIKIL